MSGSLSLDEDQAHVACAEAWDRLVVEAGPGSGKTETVSARIEHLVNEEDLYPGDVLTISFSRAAVEAVERRQRSRGTHATGWITTLDALATRLLAGADVELESMSFDKRIDRATKLLTDEDFDDPLLGLSHVIIDEAQDIVGRRAELVAALLERLDPDVGFTVLGDPLQAVYDFQLAKEEGIGRTLVDIARELGAREVRLSHQYRAISRDSAKAMALRASDTGPSLWRSEMLGWLADVPPLQDLDDLTDLVLRQRGTVAVLTDTNASALVVLRALIGAGVTAELSPRSIDRALDPWLTELLGDVRNSMSRDEFLEKASHTLPMQAEETWALMRRLTRSKTKYLDVRELTRRLSIGMAPIALGTPRRNVVVSTVHRAKGLEFDSVFLLHPDGWREEDPWALARTIYVAITRARHSLFTFRRSSHMKRWYSDPTTQRAVRSKGYGTTGFEIRGTDWRGHKPPNHDDDPAATQELLHRMVDAGPQPVTIELDAYRSTMTHPVYVATVADTPIGSLNENFVGQFKKRVKSSKGKWPALIDMYLTGVETVAGAPQKGPVGINGLWLSPRIVGPATLIWSKE